MKHFPSVFSVWICMSFLSTLLIGFIYVSVQQVLRQDANDPQIQVSGDIVQSLQSGKKIAFSSTEKVNLETSLSMFITMYDRTGQPVDSNAVLVNQVPRLPSGVLTVTKQTGEDRLTWQPNRNVRDALVVRYFKSPTTEGYVAVGRSLLEVEKRETMLLHLAILAWILELGGSFLLLLFLRRSSFVSCSER